MDKRFRFAFQDPVSGMLTDYNFRIQLVNTEVSARYCGLLEYALQPYTSHFSNRGFCQVFSVLVNISTAFLHN